MSFAPENLAVLARTDGFTLLRYSTVDEAERLVEPTYFATAAGLLRQGDIVFASYGGAGNRKNSLLLVTGLGDGYVKVEMVDGAAAANLGGLSDIALDTPAEGEVLAYQGGSWTPRDFADVHGLQASDVGAIPESEKG